MNLKLSTAALVLALAVPATAQTILTMPEGCEGATIGDVLADGTLCVVLNTGALGNSIPHLGAAMQTALTTMKRPNTKRPPFIPGTTPATTTTVLRM